MTEKRRIDAAKESLRTLKYRRQAVISMKQMLEAADDPDIKERLRFTESSVEAANRALESLSGDQAEVLRDFFIERERGYMDAMQRKYGCAQSTIYRMKNDALRAYSMAMFGSAE